MVVTCLVKGCKNNNLKSWNKRFFSLPSPSAYHKGMAELYRERRNLWVEALHRDDLTETKLKYGRICSDHFHSGKPARWSERDHPDWIPSNWMGDDISYKVSTVKLEKNEAMPEKNGLHLTEDKNSENNPDQAAQISHLTNIVGDGQKLNIQPIVPVKIEESFSQESQVNSVFEVVPNEANKKVTQPSVKPSTRSEGGRPKENKDHTTTVTERKRNLQKDDPKVPKHASKTRSGRGVKSPKHIVHDFEKVETHKNTVEVISTEFPKFLEPPARRKPNRKQGLKFHNQRRKIATQFRHPKCQKAYLGKTEMTQHIQKHPDLGPIPQTKKKEQNFDVWNFLVDITQKCPQAQRGAKFCEELTNLMHNLLLLTSALFKKVEVNKSFVEVDKVLGNAIGLKPGPYSFNDNELYKDVTVLQLLTTTDFFKPSDDAENLPKDHRKEIDEAVELNEHIVQDNSTNSHFTEELEVRPKSPAHCIPEMGEKLTSDLVIPDDVMNKTETPQVQMVQSEMLTDNSSIMHLSNIKTSVDELMMNTVYSGGTLLDNLTSSDEVMNVDQFVNERFKIFTEPELEVALNLDLNTLDLFEYENS